MTEELVQGSDLWLQARIGSLGASAIHDVMAKTKTGYSASRDNRMAALIVERLTGVAQDVYQTEAMRFGIEQEPMARAAYEFRFDVDVVTCGLFRHPTIEGTHASPDGLVGDDGLLEIKVPNSATHIETLLTRKIPEKYGKQMLWQMACTGRLYVDYVSFDPRMPEHLQLFVSRIERDDAVIAVMELEVFKFLKEAEGKMAALEKVAL